VVNHLDTGVRSILHSLEQLVVRRFESESERRVDDSSVDVDSEIDFEDVARLEDCERGTKKESRETTMSLPRVEEKRRLSSETKRREKDALVLSPALGAEGKPQNISNLLHLRREVF